jgi:dihydroorotase
MVRNLVLTNGRIIDPSSGTDMEGSVVVREGVIAEVVAGSPRSVPEDAEVLDVEGAWITPGFIDLRTHLREPGEEWKETVLTGSKAALAGGYTTICASPDTFPVNDEASVTNLIRQRGEAARGARVYPVAAATTGQKGKNLADLGDMKAAGAVAVSNGEVPISSARMMRRVMEYCLTFDLPLFTSSFDVSLSEGGLMNEGLLSTIMGLASIPTEAETIAVARDIELAALTGARVHLSRLSTAGSVRLLRAAQKRGLNITGEVTPHHLTLTEEANSTYDTNTKVIPPFRSEEDRQALIAGLADGTLTCIATDHAPQNIADKDLEFAYAQPGVVGLETAFPLLMNLVRQETLTPMQIISALTLGPARVLGMEIGTLRPGVAADIGVNSPTTEWQAKSSGLHSMSANTPFLETPLLGRTLLTIVDGEVRYRLGK